PPGRGHQDAAQLQHRPDRPLAAGRQPGRRQRHRLRDRPADRGAEADRQQGRGRQAGVPPLPGDVEQSVTNPAPHPPEDLSMSEYRLPGRLPRRDFLPRAAAGATGLAIAGSGRAEEKAATPVRLGEGKSTYTLDPAWGTLPQGMKYGLGCALVVDSKD